MAKKKTTKNNNSNPDPITLAEAFRIARAMTKHRGPRIAHAGVEVSKRRLALTLWEILDDGRVRMAARRYIYLAVSSRAQARAAWVNFCLQELA